MDVEDLSLHNVAQPIRAGETDLDLPSDGLVLQRVPEAVRTKLNPGAQQRYRHPAGVELRFVGAVDEPVTITLAATSESAVEVYWGPFRERRVTVGPGVTTISLERPNRLERLTPEIRETLAFDPSVCRLRLAGAHRGGIVALQDVSGSGRVPRERELPGRTYLAYGTSITEGEAPSAEQLTYVSQTARRLGADLRNLGVCGSAHVESAIGDYIAAQEFDVASLALSVNMIDEFTVETFTARAKRMVRTVTEANPNRPIVAITLYPYYDDLMDDGDRQKATAFRDALREAVAAVDRPNLWCVDGPRLLDAAGLGTDLLHPADDGMITMGERLAGELEPRLD